MKVLASLLILMALLAFSQATAETRSISIGKFTYLGTGTQTRSDGTVIHGVSSYELVFDTGGVTEEGADPFQQRHLVCQGKPPGHAEFRLSDNHHGQRVRAERYISAMRPDLRRRPPLGRLPASALRFARQRDPNLHLDRAAVGVPDGQELQFSPGRRRAVLRLRNQQHLRAD